MIESEVVAMSYDERLIWREAIFEEEFIQKED